MRKRRRRKKNQLRIYSDLEEKFRSSVGISSNGTENLMKTKPNHCGNLDVEIPSIEEQSEASNKSAIQSKCVSVWVCQNRQLDQRMELNLGFSPCFNLLIDQIYENFDGITEDTILAVLLNDDTWLEICVNNVNIPLIDLGIHHQSTISIEERIPMDDEISIH